MLSLAREERSISLWFANEPLTESGLCCVNKQACTCVNVGAVHKVFTNIIPCRQGREAVDIVQGCLTRCGSNKHETHLLLTMIEFVFVKTLRIDRKKDVRVSLCVLVGDIGVWMGMCVGGQVGEVCPK